jgi:hypothetical protein
LWQDKGKMSAERGSLIYIAFFNATKATIRGGLGGHVEKKNKNKSRGGVASWRFVVYQRF